MEEKIAKTLKEWFESHHISNETVAQDLSVSVQFVSMLLNGRKSIGKKLADRLCNHYGLSKAFLLTGEGDICPTEVTPQQPVSIPSYIEKLISDYETRANETISTLKEWLGDKTHQVEVLEKDKDSLLRRIQELEKEKETMALRILELENEIKVYQETGTLNKYIFPPGVADRPNEDNRKSI